MNIDMQKHKQGRSKDIVLKYSNGIHVKVISIVLLLLLSFLFLISSSIFFLMAEFLSLKFAVHSV